jgi:hypothetical protein
LDSSLRFHAVDPTAELAGSAVGPVTDRLRRAFPDAGDVIVQRWETTQLIDNGANLDRVVCPTCGDEIDGWGELMDDAWDGVGFGDLSIVTPCCGTATSLEQLTYEWPLGFGRYSLDVHEPGSNWFTPHRPVPGDAVMLLADLIETTGHRLGVVWRHL